MTSGPLPTGLFRITAPHFVAGLFLCGGYVSTAAPIIRYMKGWTYNHVHSYCKANKWKLEIAAESERSS